MTGTQPVISYVKKFNKHLTDQQTGLTLDALSIFEKCELKRKKSLCWFIK